MMPLGAPSISKYGSLVRPDAQIVALRPHCARTALKAPPKSAVERARRLEMQRNLFVVMRLCSPVVLSYLDAGFGPRCGRKDFWTACWLLLAAAAAACCC